MNRKFLAVHTTILALFFCFVSGPAWANLCAGNYVKTVHRAEAKELEKENYSDGNNCADGSSSCWIGTRTYNEMVIGCNRKRDVKPFGVGPVKDVPILHKAAGKKLDKRTKKDRKFGKNLPPRFVSGDYQYLGAADKRYGYLLERKNRNWIVTVALDFKFPKAERKKIHLPIYLVKHLSTKQGGVSLLATVCSKTSGGKNSNGMIQNRACRIDRNLPLFLVKPGLYLPRSLGMTTSKPPTEWIMHLWRESLTKIWTRPNNSFQLKVWITNLVGRQGEMEDSDLDLFRRNDAIYPVELHHNSGRTKIMYRPIKVLGVKIFKAIYTGESPIFIAHEFGHSLGLGDDYPNDSTPKPNKDCTSLSGFNGGSDAEMAYLMCSNYDYIHSVSQEEVKPHTVKSVYLWIITQRYSIGKDVAHCKSDTDCAKSQYCKDSVLKVNRCTARKAAGKSCTKDHQCTPPAICTPKPFGKCVVQGARKINEPCFNGKECVTGTCNKGLCACGEDDHCKRGQYCDKGTLKVGQNKCVNKKALGKACSRGKQCASNCCKLFKFKVQCRPTKKCN